MLLRGVRATALAMVLAAATCAPASGATLPPDFEQRTLGGSIFEPVAVAWAPDGRMFVAKKDGVVRVVAGGTLLSEPLIDISGHVNRFEDRGLLGIAVDADFETNHYLYLLYTWERDGDPVDDGPKTSRLTRVVVRPDNTVANPSAPETVILGRSSTVPCPAAHNDLDCIPSEFTSHSIGTVRADADGTLWVGSGDAGRNSAGSQNSLRAYDERSYAGKLLHVDRSGRGLPGHPFCPADADLTHVCTKVYAKGLRNPFRFALRGGGLGPIVGDVGWMENEEVNLTAPGRDYGWPCMEGPVQTNAWEDEPVCQARYAEGGMTAPDHSYGRSEGAAVVGGPAYPGGDYPDAFDGDIFIADPVGRWIRRLRLGPGAPAFEPFLQDAAPVDLQIGPTGNLVYVDLGDWRNPGSGGVREIAYCPANCAPEARIAAEPSSGAVPLDVEFDGAGSTDPDGDALTYEWDFGDGGGSSEAAPEHRYDTPGIHTARLTVTDPGGRSGTATVAISAGNTAPTAAIAAPADGSGYAAGTPVRMSGSGHDVEDGHLTGGDLEWRVGLHHLDHIHPYTTLHGQQVEFTPTPDHGADSWYEVILSARDSNGLAGTAGVKLYPRTVPLTLASVPSGARVMFETTPGSAPFAVQAAVGSKTTIAAAPSLDSGGRRWELEGWSDGGAAQHEVTVPAEPTTLVARYRDTALSPDGATPGGLAALDRGGPELVFDSRRGARDAKRAFVAGTARDGSGVASVAVAVRAPRRRGTGGCRWWSAKRRRLNRAPRPCSAPAWLPARLTPAGLAADWRVKLGRRLPPGAYEVLFRARDGLGNVGRAADGKSRVRIVVPR